MEIRLHSQDIPELITRVYPAGYAVGEHLIEDGFFSLDNDRMGKAAFKEIFFDGIHIFWGNNRFKDNIRLQFESDFETIEMHFNLSGFSEFTINTSTTYSFESGFHNIIYAPPVKGISKMSSTLDILEINMVVSKFRQMLGEPGYDFFWKQVERNIPCFIHHRNLPVTAPMKLLIGEIINCKKQGVFKKLFLESSIIELLLLQLEQHNSSECGIFCASRKNEMDKMHHAREIILNNIDNPCSLIDLARQVGTNEFSLKRGFKEVFGTTVFGMLRDERLQRARQILSGGDMNINEVSERLGYSTPSHFIAAYKKKYGITPGSLLR